MNKRYKPFLKVICILFGIIFFFNINVFALEKKVPYIEVFQLPSFKNEPSYEPFCSVGVDYSSGNITLANDTAWCEIPYKKRRFLFSDSFIASTKGYKIKAVASAPKDIFIFDSLSNSIVGSHKSYKINKEITHPSGMAYHKGNIFISDNYNNIIFKIFLKGSTAKVVESYYSLDGISGLTSDGLYLYASKRNKILKYDDNMKIVGEYKIDKFINGLTFVGNKEFVAVSDSKREIYRIKF